MAKTTKRRAKTFTVASVIAMSTACAAPIATSPAESVDRETALSFNGVDKKRLAVFTPDPDGRRVTVNYDPIDALLDGIVLRAGPSLRRPAAKPRAFTGTRFVHGHMSPLRLEGNKVLFSQLSDEKKATIAELTQNLVDFGNRVGIARLPKTEQLAYWFNLHNMLVLATIVNEYPLSEPRKLTVGPDGQALHDAPLAVVAGVPLSLRDIRIGIVYRNWEDPRVMYGFFHGDLASPSIRGRAWRAESLSTDLGVNAHEFINALRGVRRQGKTMLVSPLYDEGRGTLFVDWPEDLRWHLRNFSTHAVTDILDETDAVDYSRYEARTADLVGGRPHLPYSPITTAATGAGRNNYRAF